MRATRGVAPTSQLPWWCNRKWAHDLGTKRPNWKFNFARKFCEVIARKAWSSLQFSYWKTALASKQWFTNPWNPVLALNCLPHCWQPLYNVFSLIWRKWAIIAFMSEMSSTGIKDPVQLIPLVRCNAWGIQPQPYHGNCSQTNSGLVNDMIDPFSLRVSVINRNLIEEHQFFSFQNQCFLAQTVLEAENSIKNWLRLQPN